MNRNAISPVISIILLVAIAIGIIASLYSWLSGIQNPTQEAGSKLAGRQALELAGQLKIESIYINTSGNSTIYIRNVGSIYLSNFSLYIDGNLDKTVDIGLEVGDLGNITTSSITQAGKTYTIKVIASQGATAVKSIIA